MNYAEYILQAGMIASYVLIFAIIFAESGLFFGFFLPGDSLLFTLGILASQGSLNIWLIILLGCLAAISGDSVGYTFGRRVGPTLFKKEDSLLFRKEYLEKARRFYAEHGKITIILARYTPFVRTFAPIVAGIGKMPYSTFLIYNVVGGISWIMIITLLGYFLGNTVPNIEKYIIPILAMIILASVIPPLFHARRRKKIAS